MKSQRCSVIAGEKYGSAYTKVENQPATIQRFCIFFNAEEGIRMFGRAAVSVVDDNSLIGSYLILAMLIGLVRTPYSFSPPLAIYQSLNR